ncbi:hypothetical protein [Hymenobacter guriensis]|uniref:Helix-turn-helix domain-containing protein n=1 Tax=Hymenobacter guriensis TaxID=2793065 RepID=A0ABS0L875_9BACT|nr:hypothetical protein [Hymenobacter guriensis]MBG8556325.1 hypothetical protein [Hymenobacter guriensis]
MPNARTILDEPQGWQHLQSWFERNDDPKRPWNISAIGRHVRLPQAVVRALLKGPKGAFGMSRTAFTVQRLRLFQRMFRNYGYRVSVAEELSPDGNCRGYVAASGIQLAPYAFTGPPELRSARADDDEADG